MLDMLVAMSRHCSASIPATLADDMHSGRKKGVCVAYDCADVEVVFPILDRNVEAVASTVEVFDDRIDAPVAELVGDVSIVAVGRTEIRWATVSDVDQRLARPDRCCCAGRCSPLLTTTSRALNPQNAASTPPGTDTSTRLRTPSSLPSPVTIGAQGSGERYSS